MHGRNRRSAIFPFVINQEQIKNNLDQIIQLIEKHNPDIITLQEIDEYSVMTGSFNQFEYLAGKLNYPYQYFSPSCRIENIFISGNAILSKYALSNCLACKFDVTFPTDRMGYVSAEVSLPNGKQVVITSIHLAAYDWLGFKSRAKELKLWEKIISKSVILAGDFNCDLLGREDTLRSFVAKHNLKTFESENKNPTFPSWHPDQRIDWILITPDLSFIDCATLPERVSDHLATLARLTI